MAIKETETLNQTEQKDVRGGIPYEAPVLIFFGEALTSCSVGHHCSSGHDRGVRCSSGSTCSTGTHGTADKDKDRKDP